MRLDIHISFEISNPAHLYMTGGKIELKAGTTTIMSSNLSFQDPTAGYDSESFTIYQDFTKAGTVDYTLIVNIYANGKTFSDTATFKVIVNTVNNNPTDPVADPYTYNIVMAPGESVLHELIWEPSTSPIGATVNYYVVPPQSAPFVTTLTTKKVLITAPKYGYGEVYTWSVYAFDTYGNQSNTSVSGFINVYVNQEY